MATIEDLARRARCPGCAGNGRVTPPGETGHRSCPMCDGAGVVDGSVDSAVAKWLATAAPGDVRSPDVLELEAPIQAECLKLLEEDGWRTLVTTPVSRRAWGTGFGELGMADSICLRPLEPTAKTNIYACEVAWIEWKAGRNEARKYQREWHAKERARGFMVWVANENFPATVQGFQNFYEHSGLMRRPKWW